MTSNPAPLTDAALAEMEARRRAYLEYCDAEGKSPCEIVAGNTLPALVAEVRRLRRPISDDRLAAVESLSADWDAGTHADATDALRVIPELLAEIKRLRRVLGLHIPVVSNAPPSLPLVVGGADAPKGNAPLPVRGDRCLSGDFERPRIKFSDDLKNIVPDLSPHCLGCTPEAVRRGDPGETHQSGTVEHP